MIYEAQTLKTEETYQLIINQLSAPISNLKILQTLRIRPISYKAIDTLLSYNEQYFSIFQLKLL